MPACNFVIYNTELT